MHNSYVVGSKGMAHRRCRLEVVICFAEGKSFSHSLIEVNGAEIKVGLDVITFGRFLKQGLRLLSIASNRLEALKTLRICLKRVWCNVIDDTKSIHSSRVVICTLIVLYRKLEIRLIFLSWDKPEHIH